jgi:ABC-2 type transport system permease protein
MRAAWLIALKDLRLRLRDRSALMVGVVVPLALAFVFNGVSEAPSRVIRSSPWGGWTKTGVRWRAPSAEVVDSISGEGGIDFVSVDTAAELEQMVEDGEVGAGLVLPSGLSAAVEAGNPARLLVVEGVEAPTSASVAESIAIAFGTGVEDTQRAAAAVAASGAPDLIPQVIEAASGPGPCSRWERSTPPIAYWRRPRSSPPRWRCSSSSSWSSSESPGSWTNAVKER